MSGALLLACLLGSPPALAAEPEGEPVVEASSPTRPLVWWRYALAVVDGQLVNLTIHGVDRWVVGFEWAMVTPETIRANLADGWQWDPDQFDTNLFSHPYHGAAVFAAGRSNGLTWLESVPLVAASSYEWEMIGEVEAPSINDQLTTTFGGAFLGEVLWRLSDALLDESLSGRPRLLRELGAGVIDPYRGLDRLVTGKAWRPGPQRALPRMEQELGIGGQYAMGPEKAAWQARLHYGLRYGDVFSASRLRPFDAFELRVDGALGWPPERPDVLVIGSAVLAGGALPLGDEVEGFVGLFEDFEYLQGPVTKLGATSFGPGWISRHPIRGTTRLEVDAAALAIAIGGVDSPYAAEHVVRDYVIGSGAALRARVAVRDDRWGYVLLEDRQYWVTSATEPWGTESIGLLRLAAVVEPIRGWGIGVDLFGYDRTARYADHADFEQSFPTLQLQVLGRLR